MSSNDPRQERIAALELFRSHVPEIRGHLQFLDFLVRSIIADMERYAEETDGGTQVFLAQLIEMHLHHLEANGGPTPALQDFAEAVRVWLSGDINLAEFNTSDIDYMRDLVNTSLDTVNMTGGTMG
ncbi:MAG: hypothetical protein ACKO5E_22540 [bacterium]